MTRRTLSRVMVAFILLPAFVGITYLTAMPIAPSAYTPALAKKSDEAIKAIPRFQRSESLTVTAWAAEPLLAHPVAIALDEKGRCYVAETFRHSAGATDNRSHMYWLDDELACRTVEDRIAMYRKHLKGKFADFEKEPDRVRLVQDSNGDGIADTATVFADQFANAEDGIGAGLLARKGDVYYTCIPHLWKLRDTNNDGIADERTSLSSGYGVHVAFIGHDSHGLRMGPDGKLYFTIGDRGFNVKQGEKHFFYPDTGAVLRCNLDGSELEVVHSGLRNPQELAFDDFGNLFTVDNNSDSGDKARFIQIVEGGDSGWRIGYQYGSSLSDRGPWNAEKIWHTLHAGQPANIVPPLRHFADGPSGFTHYPGIGLDSMYDNHFFLCDFRGGSNGSGIWSFGIQPKGASYEMTKPAHFLWSILATDCDFGPDSAMYVSDWVEGWNKNGKGRIYRVSDEKAQANPAVAQAKQLIAEGFTQRSEEELTKLLGHPHQMVRQEAQFALAGKGAIDALRNVAASGERMAKVHAMWGLKQAKSVDQPKVLEVLRTLANNSDVELRLAAVKVIADRATLLEKLKDTDARVRLNAALGIAKLSAGDEKAQRDTVSAAAELLRANANADAYLRHGAVMMLTSVPSVVVDAIAGTDVSPAVRLGGVLALRRQKSALLGDYLVDADEAVATEAARAIHDEDITEAMPALAALVQKPTLPLMVGYRVLNANFRLGQPANAEALARFAANPKADEKLRIEAVKFLEKWENPPRRDAVTGLTQSLEKRSKDVAVNALKPALGGIFTGPANLRNEAAKTAAKLGIREIGPLLVTLISDSKQTGAARADALAALAALKDAKLDETVQVAIASDEPQLRNAGRKVLAVSKADEVVTQLAGVLKSAAPIIERQGAIDLLGEIKTDRAAQVLRDLVGQYHKDTLAPELHLELMEALAKHPATRELSSQIGWNEKAPLTDKLNAYRVALAGGDAESGRRVFLYKSDVSCLRCHKVQGTGGEVGPDMTGIGTKQNRAYLLESIVHPTAQIAKGFESATLFLANGKAISGVLKADTATEVKIITAEGQTLTIPKSEIDDRQAAKSAMPEDLIQKLSKRELRDLVEFMATVK